MRRGREKTSMHLSTCLLFSLIYPSLSISHSSSLYLSLSLSIYLSIYLSFFLSFFLSFSMSYSLSITSSFLYLSVSFSSLSIPSLHLFLLFSQYLSLVSVSPISRDITSHCWMRRRVWASHPFLKLCWLEGQHQALHLFPKRWDWSLCFRCHTQSTLKENNGDSGREVGRERKLER